jgi:transposase
MALEPVRNLVRLRHGQSSPQGVPDRCHRRRVSLPGPVPDADDARCPAPAARPARGLLLNDLRWVARGRALASAADQLPELGGGLPANAALARGGLLRGDDPRPAGRAAVGGVASGRPDRRDPGRPHRPEHARERRPRGYDGDQPALHVTPANAQEREQVATLAAAQAATGDQVEAAFVDHGNTGEGASGRCRGRSIRLEVIELREAKRGFVLLPRRWVVERMFAWAGRFRRNVRRAAFRRLRLLDAPSHDHRRGPKSITRSSHRRSLSRSRRRPCPWRRPHPS